MDTFKCGHPRSPDNTRSWIKKSSRLHKPNVACRECFNAKQRRRTVLLAELRGTTVKTRRCNGDAEPTMVEIEAMIAEQLPTMPGEPTFDKPKKWIVPICHDDRGKGIRRKIGET